MGKRLVRTFIALCLTLAAVAWYAIWAPHRFAEPKKIVVIGKGKSFAAAAEVLRDSGVISNTYLFRAVGKLFGIQTVRAGKYELESGMSTLEIMRDLKTGRSAISFFVTIPEGFRARQIARTLRREVGIDSARFMQLFMKAGEFGMPAKTASLEGYLFPDTYDFAWHEDEREIIGRMVGQYKRFFCDSLMRRAKELKLSVNDVMTMASIVEGEAVKAEERPIIAGLYYNRLKKKMRLEADPTIQYAIPDGPRRLSYEDLKTESPYNTYRKAGLPPGPINNPGRASILAALYPAKHQYLFFVADGNGGHVFARTYDEHMNNVRAYRRHRAEQTGDRASR
ncbi:MAG: endolytic transglycosylase MltG [Acidobacteriota bacterium]